VAGGRADGGAGDRAGRAAAEEAAGSGLGAQAIQARGNCSTHECAKIFYTRNQIRFVPVVKTTYDGSARPIYGG